MLPNETWRVEYPATRGHVLGYPKVGGQVGGTLEMHRWACTDARYSWGLHGRCPICGEHDVYEFEVTEEVLDPDVAQRRMEADIETACHFHHHPGG